VTRAKRNPNADAPLLFPQSILDTQEARATTRNQRIVKKLPGLAKQQPNQNSAAAKQACYQADENRWIHRPWHQDCCESCRKVAKL
jgi:hypothetical protein